MGKMSEPITVGQTMKALIEYMSSACTQCFTLHGKCEPSIKKPCPESTNKQKVGSRPSLKRLTRGSIQRRCSLPCLKFPEKCPTADSCAAIIAAGECPFKNRKTPNKCCVTEGVDPLRVRIDYRKEVEDMKARK